MELGADDSNPGGGGGTRYISEFPKIAEEFQGGPEDVSMIHQCLSTIEPFCSQVVPR